MYKYQIQINNYNNGFWDWVTIYAESDAEALLRASWEIANSDSLKEYHVSQIFSKEEINYPSSSKNDIMKPSNVMEDNEMDFFKVNWNNNTDQLKKIAATEEWSNNTYPNNGILANYMVNTYDKLKSEKNIIQTKDYGLFNTGLFTKYYEPIYAYATNDKTIDFLTSYELGSYGIETLPERANYFDNPELLLFDWHYQINVQYKHILEDKDNQKRIPEEILNSGNVITILDGAINTMKKKSLSKL